MPCNQNPDAEPTEPRQRDDADPQNVRVSMHNIYAGPIAAAVADELGRVAEQHIADVERAEQTGTRKSDAEPGEGGTWRPGAKLPSYHIFAPAQGRPTPTNFMRREWKVTGRLWCGWSFVFDPDLLLIDMRYAAGASRDAHDVECDIDLIVREIEKRAGIVVGKLDVIFRADPDAPLGIMGKDIDGPLTLHARPTQRVVEDVRSVVPQLVVVTVHGHRRHSDSSRRDAGPAPASPSSSQLDASPLEITL